MTLSLVVGNLPLMKIIGLVGPIASGKGAVAKYLEKKGYQVFSLSSIVREEVAKKNIPETRKALQDMGDFLRKKYGGDVLAKRTLGKIKNSSFGKVVIDSIRNPLEVDFLKQKTDMLLLGIVAPPDVRFRFLQERKNPGDPSTWENFLMAEKRDRGVGQNSLGQQVDATLMRADLIVKNDGSLDDLERKIEKVLT